MNSVQGARAAAALLLAFATCGSVEAAEPPAPPRSATSAGADAMDPKRIKAQRELEALLLQSLVAPAFAKKDSRLFGTGAAGRQWQALMTEHVARAMAASGQIRLFPASKGKGGERYSINPRLPVQMMGIARSNEGWVTVATPEGAAVSPSNDKAR